MNLHGLRGAGLPSLNLLVERARAQLDRRPLTAPAAGASKADAPRAKPPGALVEKLIASTGGQLRAQPAPEGIYRAIPELGQQIQEAFYGKLLALLDSGVGVRKGHALVVTSARNEEKDIYASMKDLVASVRGDPSTEVAVVVNASTDRTDEEVRRLARDLGPGVELVDHIRNAPQPKGPAAPGVVRLHLMEEPAPGKTRGLLKVRSLFEQQGSYPEWVVQVDADTHLSPGAVSKLVALASEGKAIGASGDAKKARRDGKPLLIPDKSPKGHFQHQTLAGSFAVSRTLPWIAGYETILERFPGCATEDTLLSVMYRVLGFKTRPRGDARDIEAEMLAPDTTRDARKQLTRWMTGKAHLDQAYTASVLKALGLRPVLHDEALVTLNDLKDNLEQVPVRLAHRGAGHSGESSFSEASVAQAVRFATILLPAWYDSAQKTRHTKPQVDYSWQPGR